MNAELVTGNAVMAGDIHVIDDPEAMGRSAQTEKLEFSLLNQFKTAEEVRAAMHAGVCRFTVFGA
jgi:hypothetical protein